MTTHANGRTRGGVRPICPARRCPYCGALLTRWCQARRIYRWGPLQVEFTWTICRDPECMARARAAGWFR